MAFSDTLGKERAETLLEGLTKNHLGEFCDLGRGLTQVSFEGEGDRLKVIEQKLGPDGTCYRSAQFTSTNLPARYRDLFVIEN